MEKMLHSAIKSGEAKPIFAKFDWDFSPISMQISQVFKMSYIHPGFGQILCFITLYAFDVDQCYN